jgi:predicted flap endonuclease-1-like 5' DNA nuclease
LARKRHNFTLRSEAALRIGASVSGRGSTCYVALSDEWSVSVREGASAAGIAGLEAARAELEAALSDNALWQALIAAADGDTRERWERELAGNPLYRSWRALNAAIESFRSGNQEITSGGEDFADASARPTAGAGNSQSPDDLTRIGGIDGRIAEALGALGFARYAQIAAWRREDVRAVSRSLGLTKEISRQNWIEQAALLELRKADRRAPVEPLRRGGIELADILQALRMDAATSRDVTAGAEPAQPEPTTEQQGESPPEELRGELQPPVSSAAGSMSQPAADAGAAVAPPAAQRASIPTVAASPHVNTGANERARRLEEERRRLRISGEMGLDGEEASVSFVIRERSEPPAASTTATAAPTATTVPARPTQAARSTHNNEGYVPHNNRAEEAEVVVIKPGNGRAHIVESHLAERGRVRRLLRSFTRS